MSKPARTKTEENRPYSPPMLSIYGNVTKLTAAGTAGVLESGSGSINKKV